MQSGGKNADCRNSLYKGLRWECAWGIWEASEDGAESRRVLDVVREKQEQEHLPTERALALTLRRWEAVGGF